VNCESFHPKSAVTGCRNVLAAVRLTLILTN
jgi:hypothetical protein